VLNHTTPQQSSALADTGVQSAAPNPDVVASSRGARFGLQAESFDGSRTGFHCTHLQPAGARGRAVRQRGLPLVGLFFNALVLFWHTARPISAVRSCLTAPTKSRCSRVSPDCTSSSSLRKCVDRAPARIVCVQADQCAAKRLDACTRVRTRVPRQQS